MRLFGPKLIAFSVLCTVTEGFFDIFRTSGSSTPEDLADPHPIRGLTDALLSRYENEVFMCDQGRKVINQTAINDGYCDCADNSDEPGTSACILGTFHCRNKGYRVIKIPSSRVDDHVCDCCDGTDETPGFCPNTCRKAAERERSALEKMVNNYRSGSAQRQQIVSSVRQQLEAQQAQLPFLEEELTTAKAAVESIKTQIKTQEESVLQRYAGQVQNVRKELDESLYLQSDLHYLAHYLANLADALDMTAEHVLEQMSSPGEVLSSQQGDENSSLEEGYGDEETIDSTPNSASITCEITQITGADILYPLCQSVDVVEEMKHVIHAILKSYRPYSELLLLLGYNALYNTFEGSAEFVKSHLSSPTSDTCPVEFESIGNICSLKDRLRSLVEQVSSTDELIRQDPDIQRLKLDLHDREETVKSLHKRREEAETAGKTLSQHSDHLAFLALKDQCFDVKDGKFSYSLCVLNRVTQREEDGNHNTVTLGEYSSLEESDEHGHSYKMHFKNGQYCHAFGARSAMATVVCGEKNVLRSASEPSTCFYTMVLESPAACTEKYAMANGLQV